MTNIYTYSTLLIPILTIIAYKYTNSKQINQLPTISHFKLLKSIKDNGKSGMLDLLQSYKDQDHKAVYVWILDWKLLILDYDFFKEIFINNRANLDRNVNKGLIFMNKKSVFVNSILGDSFSLKNNQKSKEYLKVIIPYLRNEVIKKNIDSVVLKGVDGWRREKNIINYSNKLTFNSICQILLGSYATDFLYEEFQNILKEALKVENLLFENNQLDKRFIDFRNQIGNYNDSEFFLSMKNNGFNYEEVINTVISLLFAGMETTAYTVSRSIYNLGKDLSKQNELRDNPNFIKSFIKQILTDYPSADFSFAGLSTKEGIVINNINIPKDIHCVGVLNLMNKDKDAFTTFSLGNRACSGQNMAKYQTEKIIESLLENYTWEISEEIQDNKNYPFFRRMEDFKCSFKEIGQVENLTLIEQPLK